MIRDVKVILVRRKKLISVELYGLLHTYGAMNLENELVYQTLSSLVLSIFLINACLFVK